MMFSIYCVYTLTILYINANYILCHIYTLLPLVLQGYREVHPRGPYPAAEHGREERRDHHVRHGLVLPYATTIYTTILY